MTDPRKVLGVPPNAGEEEIRAAYLRKVKEYPPDRSPEEFEKIRDAFEALRDPRQRTRAHVAFHRSGARWRRCWRPRAATAVVGPQPWREVLKGK